MTIGADLNDLSIIEFYVLHRLLRRRESSVFGCSRRGQPNVAKYLDSQSQSGLTAHSGSLD